MTGLGSDSDSDPPARRPRNAGFIAWRLVVFLAATLFYVIAIGEFAVNIFSPDQFGADIRVIASSVQPLVIYASYGVPRSSVGLAKRFSRRGLPQICGWVRTVRRQRCHIEALRRLFLATPWIKGRLFAFCPVNHHSGNDHFERNGFAEIHNSRFRAVLAGAYGMRQNYGTIDQCLLDNERVRQIGVTASYEQSDNFDDNPTLIDRMEHAANVGLWFAAWLVLTFWGLFEIEYNAPAQTTESAALCRLVLGIALFACGQPFLWRFFVLAGLA